MDYALNRLMRDWDKTRPAFEAYRELDARINRLRMFIYGQDFIFFFKYGNRVFAGTEDARLTFAAMKKHDNGFADLMFTATDLLYAATDEPADTLFRIADLPGIYVISAQRAERLLKKRVKRSSGRLPRQPSPTPNQVPIDKEVQ